MKQVRSGGSILMISEAPRTRREWKEVSSTYCWWWCYHEGIPCLQIMRAPGGLFHAPPCMTYAVSLDPTTALACHVLRTAGRNMKAGLCTHRRRSPRVSSVPENPYQGSWTDRRMTESNMKVHKMLSRASRG